MAEIVAVSIEDKIKEFEKHIIAGDAKKASDVFQQDLADGTLYNQENGFQIIEAIIGALSTLDVSTAFYRADSVYTGKNYKSLSEDELKTLVRASVSSIKSPQEKIDTLDSFSEEVPDAALYLQSILSDLQVETLSEFKNLKDLSEEVKNKCRATHSDFQEQRMVSILHDALPRFDSSEEYLEAADFVKRHLKKGDKRITPLLGSMLYSISNLVDPYKKEEWLLTFQEYDEVPVDEASGVHIGQMLEGTRKVQQRVEQYIENTPLTTQKFIKKYSPSSAQKLGNNG